jgi:hypothetical protein
MVVNQLFIEKPPLDLLNKLIKAFGLNDINDKREFSQIDINNNNTLSIFHTLEKELSKCYIPCKQKIYIDNIKNITGKEAITIFRQFLKAHNYDLYSKEKFIKNVKYMVYKIMSKQEKEGNKKTKKKQVNKDIVIVFD